MKAIELEWVSLEKTDEVIERLEQYPYAQILAKLVRMAVLPKNGLTGSLMYGESQDYYGMVAGTIVGPAFELIAVPHPSEATTTLQYKVIIPEGKEDVRSSLYFYRWMLENPQLAERLNWHRAIPRLEAFDNLHYGGGISLEQFTGQTLPVATHPLITDRGLEVNYSRWLLEKGLPELSRMGAELSKHQQPRVISHEVLEYLGQ